MTATTDLVRQIHEEIGVVLEALAPEAPAALEDAK